MQTYTLITGASGGIGKCFAERLAAKGHNLILAARNLAALQALAQTLKSLHPIQVEVFGCDLITASGQSALQNFCAPYEISMLINNAGFGMGEAFAQQDIGRVTDMLQLNMVATTKLTHAFLPSIRRHKGNIVNLASQAAFQPVPYMASYAASKAYVLHFSEALAQELQDDGVHVLALCPGPTETNFFRTAQIDLQQTRMTAGTVDQVVDQALAALADKRRVAVVGIGNQVMSFASRLLSRRLATRLAARMVQQRHNAQP